MRRQVGWVFMHAGELPYQSIAAQFEEAGDSRLPGSDRLGKFRVPAGTHILRVTGKAPFLFAIDAPDPLWTPGYALHADWRFSGCTPTMHCAVSWWTRQGRTWAPTPTIRHGPNRCAPADPEGRQPLHHACLFLDAVWGEHVGPHGQDGLLELRF